jgi:uncharacterized protein (TIGR03067 family)
MAVLVQPGWASKPRGSAKPQAAQEKPPAQKEKAAATDVFEGTWNLLSLRNEGEEMIGNEQKQFKTKNTRLVITKDKMVFQDDFRDDTTWCTYKLDPSKNPKAIDAKGTQENSETLGIYALDGDTLKICFAHPGEPRPTTLTSQAGSKTMLFSLQRTAAVKEDIATQKAEGTTESLKNLPKLIEQEKTKLRGNWERVSGGDAANRPGPDGTPVKPPPTSIASELIFEADRFVFKYPHSEVEIAHQYTLDPSQQPKWIDFAYDGPAPGGRKVQATRAIYELDGNTLKLCYSVDPSVKRATEFKEDTGLGRELMIFKRKKPEEK